MRKHTQTHKNKPWAILRASRCQYEAARPWKKAGMDRKAFEKLIQELPGELFDHLRDMADAERLADAIFKGADS